MDAQARHDVADPWADLARLLQEEHEHRATGKPRLVAMSTDELTLICMVLEQRPDVVRAAVERAGLVSARAEALASVQADYLIMTAAFRYALGRRSYMVGHVANWIEKHAATIPEHDARRIIKEIDEQAAFGEGALGMEMDEQVWRGVQKRLRASLDRKGGTA